MLTCFSFWVSLKKKKKGKKVIKRNKKKKLPKTEKLPKAEKVTQKCVVNGTLRCLLTQTKQKCFTQHGCHFHIWRRRWTSGIFMHGTKIYCQNVSYKRLLYDTFIKSRSQIYLFISFFLSIIGSLFVITSLPPRLHRHRYLANFSKLIFL